MPGSAISSKPGNSSDPQSRTSDIRIYDEPAPTTLEPAPTDAPVI